ncbi:ABC transporter ATP-binding protein [Ethanoligenens harbinense]|uniref:ABC transporter related protein n=1 Tax=Ethanoligenens harbinense (strain DSM 18485 / JCM 12961 / CGMCC 1.5033 / YUAN-3) TaxID=663278 RepID=E6U676_ETHHY|nr:ABC transporter ATP-binding protein [Ethanoligenens harbinense]ADU26843.1 ABC transporter related protein [Ethanoligenens harbinense YUAN-3]AVQ95949.1 ABC transporter ATP-binding protein [Ethanoligenens harbinense YUAN-3]AYF38611.1 ABC transporter ATP-binding protein [Ethanoligenens harbinense]AYF41357.1 ABC transporter ATP-binding protein [Ethanoligenens harbinense]QCN92190.1 ABC transporter ATP-binding protein [Ethanoligenens harbinense]
MNVIEIKNLTKYYGRSRGITDVNLRVEQGEIFGFIGPNGAGKSTTIRTLLGLIYPTSGSATVFGKSCAACPEIKKEIGYLPSEVFYYDNMRVIDLLRYSASFYKKDCTKRIHELADAMNLDVHKKIDDLSFGNKKKVGIVQGLLHEPELIILDEPTSGLDPLMQQKFFALIAAENQKGATVFFSSHILSEVQKMCNRVAFIKDGRIIRTEKMSDLQENSYKRIHLEANGPVTSSYFAMDGVRDLKMEGNTAGFLFKGNVNPLMQKLAALDLRNVSIEEPDLEEIFLHDYGREDRTV